MAKLIRTTHGLATLRLGMADTATETRVRAEFQVGDQPPWFVHDYPQAALGLPEDGDSLGEGWAHPACEIPPDLADALRDGMARSGQNQLWLEFPSPRGVLPLMPWEEQLVRVVGIGVMRLPYFTLRPHAPGHLTVVVCGSSPAAKGATPIGHIIARLADAYGHLARRVQLHIFTDGPTYRDIRNLPTVPDAILHDPDGAADYPPAARLRDIDPDTTQLNPWLLWIRDALGGQAVDVVHFVGHGYLSRGRGALAFAESPVVNTDKTWSRFVGIAQLSTFLSQIGAWSVALTGPIPNYSLVGLTALADSIAQLRPGYLLRHDTEVEDGELGQIGAALRFLYDRGPATMTPAVAYWVHPLLDADGTAPGADSQRLLDENSSSTIFEPYTVSAIDAPATPAWIAAGARSLEQAQATWLARADDPSSEVDHEAVTEALTFAARLLDQHARSTGPDIAGSGAAREVGA